MRIVDIRETAIPLKSNLRNSGFDFSEMTTSVVAVITDVVRNGRTVAGFAFNSTGRYACGAQMRDRFIPRIMKAAPDPLLDAGGTGNAPPGTTARFVRIELPGNKRILTLAEVEVVSDGNSAIYGSDAISGVINYVLRKRFDGLEVTGRDTFDRYHNVWGASVTAGKSWGTGNIIVTYDHEDREAFVNGRSKFLRRDLTPLGGVDSRANNATLGVSTPTLVTGGNGVPYSYYTIPTNAGPGTTFAQLTPGANLVDQSDYTDFLGRQKRDQAAVFFNQDLAPSVSAYLESFYTKRDTSSRSYGNSRVHQQDIDRGFFNGMTIQRTNVQILFDDIFYLRPGRITGRQLRNLTQPA